MHGLALFSSSSSDCKRSIDEENTCWRISAESERRQGSLKLTLFKMSEDAKKFTSFDKGINLVSKPSDLGKFAELAGVLSSCYRGIDANAVFMCYQKCPISHL